MRPRRGRLVACLCALLGLLVLAAGVVAFRDSIFERYSLIVPPESPLRVSEIMFNPKGGSRFEFVELQNTGSQSIALAGVRVRSGISFSFSGSKVATLEPGEYVLIVRNQAACDGRYDIKTRRVAGEYSGRLGNDGDHIELAVEEGAAFLSFDYDDSWYPSTDGRGHSLVFTDTRAPPETWRLKESWQPSTAIDGSPGGPDTSAQR